MLLYNSLSKQKELFEPIHPPKVSIYVCGPTVYDDAHLGHARSALAFDLLRRVLVHAGHEVTFVKNFTDIDDKIIAKMHQSGKSLQEIVSYYIARYKEEMHALGIEDADIEPKATESISDIIDFISHLFAKGFAYVIDDGVYFDTAKDSAYLSLSGKKIENELIQSRAQTNDQKKDPKDFALWKFSKAGEPAYESPWGQGRPGWHIECSAMIKKHLASSGPYQIDIHGGGADLLFPHHENESSQSRCESDQQLAKYWMHNGFVQIDGEKMSKSLGNSFFLKDALGAYDGEILRFYLISTHYRANFNFNEEDLLASKKRLDRLYRLKKRIFGATSTQIQEAFRTKFLEALYDDLNISVALSAVDEMISEANETLDLEPKNKELPKLFNANIALISTVLGVGEKDPFAYFQMGMNEAEKAHIRIRIEQRNELKARKDYATADAIREELLRLGIMLMDTPSGTVWEKVQY